VEDVGLPAAQKAVELAPDDATALDVLGWTYLSSGRLSLAEQTLLRVIDIAPELASAHLHLGMTYLAQAHRDAAHLELTRARDLDPQGEVGQFAAQLFVSKTWTNGEALTGNLVPAGKLDKHNQVKVVLGCD
jgi:Flp pilus assembly protein TadD